VKKPEDPNPNATIQIDAAEAAEVVLDASDVDVASIPPGEGRRTAPPPLPPEIRASHVPSAPPPRTPSIAPPPAPGKSRYLVYALILIGALAVALVLGAKLASMFRHPPPVASAAPSARPSATTPAVISIPVIDMADTDAGP
jgi:hypothetical protein